MVSWYRWEEQKQHHATGDIIRGRKRHFNGDWRWLHSCQIRAAVLTIPFLSVFFPRLCFVLQPVGKAPWMCLMSCKQDWHHFRRFIWQCGQGTYLHSTFLSKCLSRRVSASVSPPGHTAEDKPSVSKPEGKERREPTPLLSLLWYRNHFVSDPISLRKKKKAQNTSLQAYTGLHRTAQNYRAAKAHTGPHRPTLAHTGPHRSHPTWDSYPRDHSSALIFRMHIFTQQRNIHILQNIQNI